MIEKKFLEILEPVVDEIVALEKRVGELQRTPGPAGADGKDGRDGRDASAADVKALLADDAGFRSALKGEPGIDGKDGRDGADAKDVDPTAVAAVLKADPDFVARVRGEKGDPGEKGQDGAAGRDGADATPVDPVEVAKALMRDEGFVLSVSKQAEEVPWVPGIHREGKLVSAYMGRSYVAVCDTTDEPGDSPHWKRVGTLGMRDTGGFEEARKYEPGDLYHKDGGTFLFDGANTRLYAGKSVSPKDIDKALKPLLASISALLDRVKVLEVLSDDQRAEIERMKSGGEEN